MEQTHFQITRGCLSLLLPEDLGGQDTRSLRESLLKHLHQHHKTNSVIFDCTKLNLLDQRDLDELMELVTCIKLMGKNVGFCSIGATLAAILVTLKMDTSECHFGQSLDDVIKVLGN